MKAIAVSVVVINFLSLSISSSYKVYVRRSAEPTLADGNDLSNSMDTSGNSLTVPEDDPNLQNSLKKVMQEMDEKLNRTPFDEMKSTQKLKLFFVSPSPTDESANNGSFEDAGIPEYSDAEYSIASAQANRQTRGGTLERSVTDQFKNFEMNEESNLQKPDFPTMHKSHGQETPGSENSRNNDAGAIVKNSSLAAANDKVEMKVELTINLAEDDQHQHFHTGSHPGIPAKNTSSDSDHIYASTKAETTDPTVVKTNSNPNESDPVLNIAAGNLNLNIKLMQHNHTDMTESNDKNKVKETLKELEKAGGARSLNVLDRNMNADISANVHDMRNKTHKTKKDVNNSEYTIVSNPKHKSPQTSRKSKPTEMVGKTDDVGTDDPSSEKPATRSSTEAQSDPSATESTSPQSNGNKTEMNENTLSDSLKTIIQNLTKYYANENGGHSQDGENLIRNISKFLPGNGGTPEEQNYLQQLRQYLSQPNLFSQIGFPNKETLTDFETFLEILKKLRRSKLVRESGYYPIISEYLNFYDILNPGTGSSEENSSEEDSWSYGSSLFDSLLDYLFDDDGNREGGTKSGDRGKLISQRSDSNDSPESESDEWSIL